MKRIGILINLLCYKWQFTSASILLQKITHVCHLICLIYSQLTKCGHCIMATSQNIKAMMVRYTFLTMSSTALKFIAASLNLALFDERKAKCMEAENYASIAVFLNLLRFTLSIVTRNFQTQCFDVEIVELFLKFNSLSSCDSSCDFIIA